MSSNFIKSNIPPEISFYWDIANQKFNALIIPAEKKVFHFPEFFQDILPVFYLSAMVEAEQNLKNGLYNFSFCFVDIESGTPFYGEINTFFGPPDNNGESNLVVGFVKDTSAAVGAYKKLKKAQEISLDTVEILAHDIRNPITTILHVIRAIEAEKRKGKEVQYDLYTGLIDRVCKESLNFLTRMLELVRLEDQSLALHKEPVDLKELLNSITKDYEVLTEIPLNFKYEYPKSPVVAEIETVRFQEVINNLISNSVKFTPKDGLIEFKLTETAHNILLSIKDSGIGIPEKLIPEVFNRFSKARRKGLQGQKSTGLGMAITKKIVELHDGKIWVESKVNAGTTFYIELPKPTNLKP